MATRKAINPAPLMPAKTARKIIFNSRIGAIDAASWADYAEADLARRTSPSLGDRGSGSIEPMPMQREKRREPRPRRGVRLRVVFVVAVVGYVAGAWLHDDARALLDRLPIVGSSRTDVERLKRRAADEAARMLGSSLRRADRANHQPR